MELAGAILERLRKLRDLQDVDNALDSAERRLRLIEDEARREEERVRLAEAALRVKEQEAQDLRKLVDKKELELKGKEDHAARLLIQLNTVKTNREYTALQHEIAGLKVEASSLEDESLRMMEEIEDAHRRHAEEAAKFKAFEAELAASRKQFEARRQEVAARIRELQRKREEELGALDAAHRELYERLRTKVDGKAVVAAMRGACQGCFMDLTSNTINHLMGGDELIRCHSCGRILYLAQDVGEEEEE